jgi:pimeloyl-ACP methyl ester carboxylesterase
MTSAGELTIRYQDWQGPTDANKPAHTLMCVHGLTRNGRDFDYLAKALSSQMRVVCPDMPGRGNSDWLKHGKDYDFPLYLEVVNALYTHLNVPIIDYLGTSMGGIIGMHWCAEKYPPIRRLVLNDVGPVLSKVALKRIAKYTGNDPLFDSVADLEKYLRSVMGGWGRLTDEQWSHLTTYSARKRGDKYGLAYDPKIGDKMKIARYLPLWMLWDITMWDTYDAIRRPTLLIRGAHSDLLLRKTAEEMLTRGPKPQLFEVPDAGHAPALMNSFQIDAVRDFLTAA